MPQITFTMDANGENFEMHVEGIKGPGCESIEKIAAEIFGTQSTSQRTSDYNQATHTVNRITTRGGQ